MLDWICSMKHEMPQSAELTCYLSPEHCHFTLPVSDGFLQVQVETHIKEAKQGTVSRVRGGSNNPRLPHAHSAPLKKAALGLTGAG